jgi:hypothetical protein
MRPASTQSCVTELNRPSRSLDMPTLSGLALDKSDANAALDASSAPHRPASAGDQELVCGLMCFSSKKPNPGQELPPSFACA